MICEAPVIFKLPEVSVSLPSKITTPEQLIVRSPASFTSDLKVTEVGDVVLLKPVIVNPLSGSRLPISDQILTLASDFRVKLSADPRPSPSSVVLGLVS